MLFNSVQFVIFFTIFLIIYVLIPKKIRWLLLLIGSYLFYASWNPKFLGLLLLSTVVNYFVSIYLHKQELHKRRVLLLVTGLTSNLSILFIFKYYNFFLSSFAELLATLNIAANIPTLHVILPVGISFYTFQVMGYIIDVFNRRLEPEPHFGRFALFVSFFPQLIAGPIERASNLLPQLRNDLEFNYEKAKKGIRLMVWGYFLKMVVADNLAVFVDFVYADPSEFSGFPLILATLFFSFQIYCDFAGYSYIAIGAARILGVELKDNFRQPYLSTSIQEFWQWWHISLSNWFRDYLFFPLSRALRKSVHDPHNMINLIVPPMITMLASGLWHGANWTFVIWGGIHGLYVVIAAVINRKRGTKKSTSRGLTVIRWAVVNLAVCSAWVFFRANSVKDAWYVFTHMHQSLDYYYMLAVVRDQLMGIITIMILLYTEFLYRHLQKRHISLDSFPRWIRWGGYILLCLAIFNLSAVHQVPFIYFQF